MSEINELNQENQDRPRSDQEHQGKDLFTELNLNEYQNDSIPKKIRYEMEV